MNYLLASAIYKGVWAIDPAYVQAQLPVLNSFLSGETIVFGEPVAFQTRIQESERGNVAIVPIKDVLMKNDTISHTGTSTIGKTIQMLDKSPDIDGIVLDIDSPGGQVDGSQNLHDIIKNVTKPVVAFGNGLMASAAYWVGSAADKVILGSETTIVGSVGSMLTLNDLRNWKNFKGIKFLEVYASKSTEKNKEFRDLLDGNPETIQKNLLDPMNEVFHSAVKSNRPIASEDVFAGKAFIGEAAIKNGIADEIGSIDTAINSIYELQNTVKMFNKFPKLKALKGKKELTDAEIAEVNQELAEAGLEGLQIQVAEKPAEEEQVVEIVSKVLAEAKTDVKKETDPTTLEMVADQIEALADACDTRFNQYDKDIAEIKGNITSDGNPKIKQLPGNALTVVNDNKNYQLSPMNRRMKEIQEKVNKLKTA